MNAEASPKEKGIRVDVPSELSPDDFRELIRFCLLFEDGRPCHFGVGETRVFLVRPSRISEANKILKHYGVKVAKTSETGGRHS